MFVQDTAKSSRKKVQEIKDADFENDVKRYEGMKFEDICREWGIENEKDLMKIKKILLVEIFCYAGLVFLGISGIYYSALSDSSNSMIAISGFLIFLIGSISAITRLYRYVIIANKKYVSFKSFFLWKN